MSEPASTAQEPSLALLREAGAQRLDPVRFRYLEALSQRLDDGLQGEVRALIQARLRQALADYAARFDDAQQGTHELPAPAPGAAERPLAALNRYLRERTQAPGESRSGNTGFAAALDAESATEMKSVRRFREAWSRIAAEDQVELAAGRGPVNAGPLNSHMLVLRSLEWMRDLSPDYLQHFLAQADALLWLEQVQQKVPAKPARRKSTGKA